MPDPVVYAPADRPLVEVEHDGTWWPGELRMWTPTAEGWAAQVTWSRAAGDNRIDTFPEQRVRKAS
jgi:hypothetical protein